MATKSQRSDNYYGHNVATGKTVSEINRRGGKVTGGYSIFAGTGGAEGINAERVARERGDAARQAMQDRMSNQASQARKEDTSRASKLYKKR